MIDTPKVTLSPSFHIEVTRVSPGYATPANLEKQFSQALFQICDRAHLVLMSLQGPKAFNTWFAEIPKEARPINVCQGPYRDKQ
jgi:hypothetical protein